MSIIISNLLLEACLCSLGFTSRLALLVVGGMVFCEDSFPGKLVFENHHMEPFRIDVNRMLVVYLPVTLLTSCKHFGRGFFWLKTFYC